MRKYLSALCVVAALVLASTSLYAWSGGCWVFGANEYSWSSWNGYYNLGLGTGGSMATEYGEGNTYIQVVTDGMAGRGTCTGGFPDQGWCADNAHAGLGGWTSRAEQTINAVPYGWWTGSSRHFINGQYQVTRHAATYFQEAPNCSNPQTQFDYSNCPGSPIVIATGKSLNYSLTRPKQGVLFDLDGDGVLEQISWTKENSEVAFLALDRNGNGVIDNGTELFGDHTLPGVANGFAALHSLGGVNDDGMIDANDPLFASLLLWTDRNHNGISEPDELAPASNTLEAIGLGYTITTKTDSAGNLYRLEGWARRAEDGKTGKDKPSGNSWQTRQTREFRIYDVYLVNQ